MRIVAKILLFASAFMAQEIATAADFNAYISLKQPGNTAKTYRLTERNGVLTTQVGLPVSITKAKAVSMQGIDEVLTIKITAQNKVYINFGAELSTDFATDDCEFYARFLVS